MMAAAFFRSQNEEIPSWSPKTCTRRHGLYKIDLAAPKPPASNEKNASEYMFEEDVICIHPMCSLAHSPGVANYYSGGITVARHIWEHIGVKDIARGTPKIHIINVCSIELKMVRPSTKIASICIPYCAMAAVALLFLHVVVALVCNISHVSMDGHLALANAASFFSSLAKIVIWSS